MKLYIDPGTGSMIFALLVGLLSAVSWILRQWAVKLRFLFSGGKKDKQSAGIIPFVIYGEDKRYWSVFEPVCRELNARGFETVYMTGSEDDPALSNPYEHIHAEFIGSGNKAFMKLNMLNATLLLATTPGLDVYQWKRSKGVRYYVHMLHAPGTVTMYRMFALDYYDAVLLAGEYQREDERALEELRNLPEKELTLVGLPYLDEMANRLAATPKEHHEGTTVLLAPTWGKNGVFSVYGGRVLDELLKTDYHIIVRPHPQSFISETAMMEELMAKYPSSERLEWNRDADNFEVLRRSDILISDYSGVIFEFSLVYDKPVIYASTALNTDAYDAWWLDTPVWTLSALPKIGEKLNEDNLPRLREVIESCLTEERYAQGRKEVRDAMWCFVGEGARTTADYLISKYQELIGKEN